MTQLQAIGAGAPNPVLAEATRGDRVESIHRGAVAVADNSGALVLALGDVEAAIYARSAVKPIQALPLVDSGAAEAFGFGTEELALAEASHGGEPDHIRVAAAMLAAIGLDESDLECGAHSPSHRASSIALRKAGREPGPLHNNCSGKHAGFLALARHRGLEHRGYVHPDHPVQELIREALSDLTGLSLKSADAAVDGCSIPTYPTPLASLATAFARFATGKGLAPARAQAARHLFSAATANPFYIGGTGMLSTEIMDILDGRILIKNGAEGVYCATVPDRGLGIALKCDDGSSRGAEAMIGAVVVRLFPQAEPALAAYLARPIKSVRGMQVGVVRPLADAFSALS